MVWEGLCVWGVNVNLGYCTFAVSARAEPASAGAAAGTAVPVQERMQEPHLATSTAAAAAKRARSWGEMCICPFSVLRSCQWLPCYCHNGSQLSRKAGKYVQAPHSSTLAWKTPWTEEPSRLQSMGLLRVGHDWATSLHFTSTLLWNWKLWMSNWCVHALSLSNVWFFVIPLSVAHQAPLAMGFPRQEYWRWLSFPSPGDLPNPGIEPKSPALAGGFFSTEPLITREMQSKLQWGITSYWSEQPSSKGLQISHLAHSRPSINHYSLTFKKSTNNKCWRECGEKETPSTHTLLVGI